MRKFNNLSRKIKDMESSDFTFYITFMNQESDKVTVYSDGKQETMDKEEYKSIEADRKIFRGSKEAYEKYTGISLEE